MMATRARERGLFWRSAFGRGRGTAVMGGALASALLVGVALFAAHTATETMRDDAQNRARSNRDAAVRAITRQTEDFKRSVTVYAGDPAIVSAFTDLSERGKASARVPLAVLARSKGSRVAFLSDLSGLNVTVFPDQPELDGRDFSFRDWFKGVSRTGAPYVSEGYRSAATGQPMVVGISTPVFRGPERVGYLTLLWPLDSVRALVEGTQQDDGVTLTVTDQAGQSLLEDPIVDDRGQPVAKPLSPIVAKALSGRSATTRRSGTLSVAGPVPNLNWTVTASLPESVALAPAASFRRSLLVILALSLLAITAFAAAATRMAGRRQRAETELRTSESRFRRIFDEGLNGELLVSLDGAIVRVNASFARQIGVDSDELEGRPLLSLFTDVDDQRAVSLSSLPSAEATHRHQVSMLRADGRTMRALIALSWVTDTASGRVLLVQVEDITARLAAEQALTELALYDSLTGLPNRRLLIERCHQAFARASGGRNEISRLALMFIDLDGFKPVNDHHGHGAGDALLTAIANDLEGVLRPTETVARVGGDEFVVLVEGGEDLEQLRQLAARLTETVRRQVSSGGRTHTVTASIGIAHADLAVEPTLTPEMLLQRADTAMYRAKERGRNRHDTYDDALRLTTHARLELEQSVRDALVADRLHLVFQSVIDIDNDVVLGAEALLRLRDAGGRPLPTLPAIIAAEDAGIIDMIGDRVLDLALHAASRWPTHMTVAVNVSARELTGAGLLQRVDRSLAQHQVDPRRLVLEITETSLLSAGPSALTALNELRRQGIKIAIDDFGTAYATLQNLTTLPVDVLKVDATFTAGLPDQRTHTAIVHGIASMARELSIPCIVEGVETQEQVDALRGLGLHAQGWFWGQPQAAPHTPTMPQALPTPRSAKLQNNGCASVGNAGSSSQEKPPGPSAGVVL